MDINTQLGAGLDKLISISPAVLSYQSGSTTVSASVARSYTRYERRTFKNAGVEDTFDDMYVMARPSDVESWGLEALKSQVALDSEPMMIGNTIKKSIAFWKIFLRRRQ